MRLRVITHPLVLSVFRLAMFHRRILFKLRAALPASLVSRNAKPVANSGRERLVSGGLDNDCGGIANFVDTESTYCTGIKRSARGLLSATGILPCLAADSANPAAHILCSRHCSGYAVADLRSAHLASCTR